MLMIGDIKCLPSDLSNIKVFNLSSLLEGFERINLLPPFTIDYNDQKGFDMIYAEYILSNDSIFLDLMKIIYQLYLGVDVFILVTRNEFYDIVTESLLKFIQQRYGYNSYFINELEDLECADTESSFSLQGLFNLDQDKDRLSYLIAPTMLNDKGEINGSL